MILKWLKHKMIDSQWTEIIISIPAKDVDTASDIAHVIVPYGIYIEDYSNLEVEALEIAHIDLIDEDLLAKNRETALIHIYISQQDNPLEAIAFLTERYTACGIKHEIDTKNCLKEDWINNWKKYFKPLSVGEKLLVRPTWEDEYDSDGRTVLHLEPGLAFGTGTHETTRLCMELIEKYQKDGDDVLDMGCGSGILSVASLLLGAKSAVGVDIDPLAVKTALENVEVNAVADKFTGICGNLTEKVTGKFNLLLANIVADAIIMLSKDAPKFMYENSVYIVSGIIDTRENDVIEAITPTYKIIEKREENGWVAMALTLA